MGNVARILASPSGSCDNDRMKKLWMGIAAVVIAGIALFFFLRTRPEAPATVAPASPSIPDSSVNVPSVNPIEKVNPFENVYKNPFD